MTRNVSIETKIADTGVRGDDDHLVDRFLRGDRSAFETIVDRHQPPLLRLAYRLLGWSDDAREVVQDVFLAALRSMSRFDRRAGLGTWLTVITVNKCRTHRRRRWLRLHAVEAMQAPRPQRLDDSEASAVEQSARVRRAVEKLPQRCREVIVLRYLEDMPIERMAIVLSMSANAVHARLYRAKRRLEPLLSDCRED